MTHLKNQSRTSESGFTLVELAIVMIIIGLLIGGILKGQELINNARLSSTVTQAKAVESGVSGFRDKFGGMPGDVTTPQTRLPNCAAGTICGNVATGGLGDGFAQTGTVNNPTAAAIVTSEAGVALAQLGATGFLGGMTLAAAAGGNGISNPETPLGGVWSYGYSNGVVAPTAVPGTVSNPLPGHYIWSNSNLFAAAAAAAVPFEPAQAQSLDLKLDDGQPNSGSVRGIGAVGAGNCISAATALGIYQTATTAKVCGVLVKVQ